MLRVSVAGHLCVDLVPELPQAARFAPGQLIQVGPLDVRLGGCVANTGLVLADLGAEPLLQAGVGDDPLGTVARDLLGDRAHLAVLPGRTTSYSIVLEPGGADRTFWHHTGANEFFDTELVSVDTDLLHLGYPPLLPGTLVEVGQPLVDLLTRARAAGVTTSLDLAVVDQDSAIAAFDWEQILTRVLPLTDVISPSTDDLASMLAPGQEPSLAAAEEWCDHLLAQGVAIALVTAGRHGMVLASAGMERIRAGGRVLGGLGTDWDHAWVRLPATPNPSPATSTGAGDAASAGLLQALLLGLGPTAAAAFADRTARLIMSGTRPSLLPEEIPGGQAKK